MIEVLQRQSADVLLAKLKESERARFRLYIGAAAGVGKTYQMLEDAHLLKREGIDVVIGIVEDHKRAETAALAKGLEQVPLKQIEYKGAILQEMSLEEILTRKPTVVLIDELAHTNVHGSKNQKRYEDVLELLNNNISVISAVNVQHIESLNDVIEQITGVRVKETIPDSVLRRADEVVNVDVSVDLLRTRLRQGKIYDIEKIEQSLNNFFRKGNLTALRELALRQVAEDQATKAQDYREQEGLQPAAIPEKVMVCIASRGAAKNLLRIGSRIAGKYATDWYAVYVETQREAPGKISPEDFAVLQENIKFAKRLGAQVVHLKANRVADALINFANAEGITHIIFGHSERSRWNLFINGSIINRFLNEVRHATVQVVPPNRP